MRWKAAVVAILLTLWCKSAVWGQAGEQEESVLRAQRVQILNQLFGIDTGEQEEAALRAQRVFDQLRDGFPPFAQREEVVLLIQQVLPLFVQGKYTEAALLVERAVEIVEKALGPEDSATARSLGALATAYQAMGTYERALPLAQRALSIFERTSGPEHLFTANSLTILVMVYQAMGAYEQALPLAQRALAISEKTSGPENPFTTSALSTLAAIYQSMGAYERALPLAQRALAISEKTLGPESLPTAYCLNILVGVYGNMGAYEQALPLAQRALAISEKTSGPENPFTVETLHNLALLSSNTGDYKKALEEFQRALAGQDRTFSSVFAIASEEQKIAFVKKSSGSYHAALSLIQHRFQGDALATRWGLELVLRRKGIILEAQSRTQEALVAHLTGEARQSWQRLTQHRSTLAHLLLSGPGKQNPADYRKAVEELYAAIAREEEFLARHNGLVAQELAQRQVTAQRLAERLPKDSALVEFVRVRLGNLQSNTPVSLSRYLAFVLTSDNQVTLVVLGDADKIDAKINEVLAAIDDPEFRQDLAGYTSRANDKLAELYDLFVLPLEDTLGSRKRLIVSPDGELSKVPFAALPTPDGRYLIEKMAVSYVASGRDLLRGGAEEPARINLLLAASPAFDDRDVFQKTSVSEDAVRAGDYGERFAPLPGTAEEASIIPPLLQGTQKVLQGTEATESAVRSTKSPKVLHLATHGFFLKDEEMSPPEPLLSAGGPGGSLERGKGGVKAISSPAGNGYSAAQVNPMVRSGLALAGANHAKEITTGDDGILTALEVSGMDLYGTDLVVLSACETGVGDVKVGEGVYGLRRAFVLAGAKNLVMSLWAVNDKITLEQMAEFYRGYAKGKSPAAALRAAQLKSIASLRERTKATVGESLAPVRLWAPFIIQQTGEGVGSPQLMMRTAAYGWWNLVVPLLAVVGLFVLSRVRLNTVPIETESRVAPVAEAAQPSTLYARLVRRSPLDNLPREIAFIHDNTLIGSGPECDVILKHPSIARQHARVQWRKQGYVLCAIQGVQRTFVSGRPIVENLLKEGWVVQLGEVEFVFYDAKSHRH